MKNLLILPAILIAILLAPSIGMALPAPCTQDELLESSDFAIEGTVTKIECGEPYESNQCKAKEGASNFVPELLAKCTATVRVTESIKGQFNKGDEAIIPYLQLVQSCEGGEQMLPGSPVKNFVPNSLIKYYNSEQCKFWNYSQIKVPPSNN